MDLWIYFDRYGGAEDDKDDDKDDDKEDIAVYEKLKVLKALVPSIPLPEQRHQILRPGARRGEREGRPNEIQYKYVQTQIQIKCKHKYKKKGSNQIMCGVKEHKKLD